MMDAFHLMFEGWRPKWLGPLSQAELLDYLVGCPGRIDMTIILDPETGEPYLTTVQAPEVDGRPGGWGGVVVIAESHISVHSRGLQVLCDVFSCKPFTQEIAVETAVQYLGLVDVVMFAVARGGTRTRTVIAATPPRPSPDLDPGVKMRS